jgi:hypothetical protein
VHPLNKSAIDVIFISNLFKEIFSKEEQPKNNPDIVLALLVLKFDKSIDVNFEQYLKAYPIYSTLLKFNWEISIDCKDEQLENKYSIDVT